MPAKSALRQAESAESQNRTGDTAIFSRVLYQLSYLGLNVQRSLFQSDGILHSCTPLVNVIGKKDFDRAQY